ncbi:RusA family crossover junction endodeoxyribonuclease [Micavibrio aeruginosavorus]|uniref:Crossover junction endodeoxyribonuclease RusA n=1 Tax=Micavibrio aeruginosavorus (strain ARL-13) TaxID=856793 RepID=G2KMX7_MICAA|nr:RusA family crossover junction endodeoxyribonuclease [Micavibrio aeruginosavorus]AEP08909.1 endodeoxyribonuclease RusA family protein [Micavibrio aeruginosavorus ARL-13]
MFEALLPIPPSVNAAYRAVNGRVIKSARYRAWSAEAEQALKSQIETIAPMTGRLIVHYGFGFPDKRRRDIANFEKALSDFLEESGVYLNDCQIDDMRMTRLNTGNGVYVTIKEIQP